MWDLFWGMVWICLAALAAKVVYEAIKERFLYPFQWHCNQCNFLARSNKIEILQRIKEAHNHFHYDC